MGGSSIMASAGRVLPLPKGAYSSSTTYHLLDFVSYQGSTYICKQTSTGNAPTNTTYWQIMAQGTESASVAGNYYGTCSTGANTSAKIVSIPATENFVLQVGDIIGIKFDNTNTANNPSLNVNNSGAKPIYYNNSAVSTSNLWASGEANRVTIFMYDGTNWIWMGHDVDIDTDTLSDLKDTTISSASNGQVLMYDSTSNKWKNQTPTTTLAGLSDTQISSATDGQVLKYNSTSQKWVNGEDKGGILPHLIVISETGSTVTATKGQTVITATETSTGHFECDLTELGTWTIDAILGGDDAQVSLVVDTVKVYTVDDSHFHASVTVTYPIGSTCKIEGQGETYYATTDPYTFTVHHTGTYILTCTLGTKYAMKSVTITTDGQTENVSFTIEDIYVGSVVTPTNDIQTWLYCAGIIDKNYTSLNEVLSDTTTLSILISSNNACDYLVRCTSWISGICSNQSAMSYIGLNNYCANTLLANADWCEGIGNSEYFESVLNVKVPTMTSNTTPSGVASASSTMTYEGQTFHAYLAFDKTNSKWIATSATNQWVQYNFTHPFKVCKIYLKVNNYTSSADFRVKNFEIRISSDNFTTYTTIFSGTMPTNTGGILDNIIPTTISIGQTVRLFVLDSYASPAGISVEELQFYGRVDV